MRSLPFQRSFLHKIAWSSLLLAISIAAPAFAENDVQELTASADDARQLTEATADVKSLDVYTDGAVIHLLTGEADVESDGVRLFYRRSSDGGASWTKSVRVDEGSTPPHKPRRGADAQLAASGNHLVAVWSIAGTGFEGGGPLVTAISADGGLSWQTGSNPANDNTTAGHEFADILADAQGFHTVWLNTLTQTDKKSLFSFFKQEDAQGLHYARSGDNGKSWSAHAVLDTQTCECCANKLVGSSDGTLYTLYRDTKPRDMSLFMGKGQDWQQSGTIGNFDWDVDACPHTGGGLVVLPGQNAPVLHAAVWTGKKNQAGIYHLSSVDGGESWSEPRQLGDARTKYPDIAATLSGDIAMVWNGLTGDDQKAAVFGALSKDGGQTWSVQQRLSAVGVTASHPRVIAVGEQFRVFWTQGNSRQPHSLVTKNLQ